MRHRLLIVLTMLCASAPTMPAAASPAPICVVSVLQADELPYAPFGTWLVKATLQITPQSGVRYQTTLFEALQWHKTLRRGDRFGIRCDRFQPETLRLSDLVR